MHTTVINTAKLTNVKKELNFLLLWEHKSHDCFKLEASDFANVSEKTKLLLIILLVTPRVELNVYLV